jgi:putative transposase
LTGDTFDPDGLRRALPRVHCGHADVIHTRRGRTWYFQQERFGAVMRRL